MTQQTGLNIYQRINNVRNEDIYLKKGSAGQGTGVQYDDFIALIRPCLVAQGIVIIAEKYGDARSRANAKGNYIYECDFSVHYINMDNPEDRFTTIVESHAMDAGDKAPSKAITYATKISMLKVFSVEAGDNEESRGDTEDKKNVINTDQFNELSKYCVGTNEDGSIYLTDTGQKLLSAYKLTNLESLPVSKYEDAMKRCKARGEVAK